MSPFEEVVVDLGTGDGLFAYRSAQAEPRKFFIGIDANRRPLEKISEKIHRKPAKGGLPNVVFIQSAVESLPSELDSVAGEVSVNFPWGSLLAAVVGVDAASLRNIRRMCRGGARLNVTLGVDPARDRTEIERLNLPDLTSARLVEVMTRNYEAAGFRILESRNFDSKSLGTSWAKRLANNPNRHAFVVSAEAK